MSKKKLSLNETPSSTYCSYLWRHLCVRPNFQLQPCCRYDSADLPEMKIPLQVEDSLNHPYLLDLRRQAEQGNELDGCSKCYAQEKAGILSLREVANSSSTSSFSSTKVGAEDIDYLELFLGDTCNLKCVMCHPELSTQWRKDYEALGWELAPRPEQPDFCQLVRQFPHLKEIKVVGGEPFLSPQHLPVLQELKARGASKIKLVYFTNATVLPSEEVLDVWKSFAEVEIWLSIDGIARVNDYIRFPSRWEVIAKNTRTFLKHSGQFENIDCHVMCTVSVLNVWSLSRLEKWFQELKEEVASSGVIKMNPLVSPSHLSLHNLPGEMKEAALQGLDMASEEQGGVAQWIKNSPEQEFEQELVTYLSALDRVRGNSLVAAVPELASLFQQKS